MPELGYEVVDGISHEAKFSTSDEEDYPEDEENAPTPQYVIDMLGFDPKADPDEDGQE